MINGLTLEEMKQLADKQQINITVNDGNIDRIPRGKAPEEKETLAVYKADEVDAFLNSLGRRERMYLLSHISWQERLESLAEKMDADTAALDVIYLRAKAVRC